MPWVWINDYTGGPTASCVPPTITYPIYTSTSSTTIPYGYCVSQMIWVSPPMGIQPVSPLQRVREVFDRVDARRQEQAALHRERDRRDEIRNARDKAQELLLRNLTEEQRESFVAAGFFMVIGQRTKKRYRIDRNNYAGNIQELGQNNDAVARLCCHLACDLPLADHLLAQKLSLEADEDAFLRLANRNQIVRA